MATPTKPHLLHATLYQIMGTNCIQSTTEEFALAHSSRVQSTMVGKSQQREPEVAGHMVSIVGKQTQVNISIHHSPFYSVQDTNLEWCCLSLGWIFSPQLIQFK